MSLTEEMIFPVNIIEEVEQSFLDNNNTKQYLKTNMNNQLKTECFY